MPQIFTTPPKENLNMLEYFTVPPSNFRWSQYTTSERQCQKTTHDCRFPFKIVSVFVGTTVIRSISFLKRSHLAYKSLLENSLANQKHNNKRANKHLNFKFISYGCVDLIRAQSNKNNGMAKCQHVY